MFSQGSFCLFSPGNKGCIGTRKRGSCWCALLRNTRHTFSLKRNPFGSSGPSAAWGVTPDLLRLLADCQICCLALESSRNKLISVHDFKCPHTSVHYVQEQSMYADMANFEERRSYARRYTKGVCTLKPFSKRCPTLTWWRLSPKEGECDAHSIYRSRVLCLGVLIKKKVGARAVAMEMGPYKHKHTYTHTASIRWSTCDFGNPPHRIPCVHRMYGFYRMQCWLCWRRHQPGHWCSIEIVYFSQCKRLLKSHSVMWLGWGLNLMLHWRFNNRWGQTANSLWNVFHLKVRLHKNLVTRLGILDPVLEMFVVRQ